MKYIDAEQLKAVLERQNAAKNIIEPLIRIIDSLTEQPELPNKEIAEYYYHKGMYEGLSQGRADALKILEKFMKTKAEPVIVIKQQEQSVVKKSNALFDKCVENCDPAVMKEVSDNVDKMLGKHPVEGLDVTDFCKPVEPGIAKCVADHWWELLDDENAADEKVVKEFSEKVSSEITRQVKDALAKQPASEEQVEAAEEYNKQVIEETKCHHNALTYAEGYEDALLLIPDAFIAGAEWDRAKMMEGAVEGKVIKSYNPVINAGGPSLHGIEIIYPDKDKPYLIAGDKVRIIVIKEDEK